MDWLEVFLETTKEGLEAASALLMECGVTGMMVHDPDEFQAFLDDHNRQWDYIEDGLVEETAAHPAGVTFFVRDNIHGAETISAVKSAAKALLETEKELDLGPLTVSMKNIREEDWANNWKKYFKPFPVGQKLMVKPSWEDLKDTEGRTVLNIDPGHVFGTGTHETTRCCMEEIETYLKEGDRVLDIGCGSGILSIASLLLGAKSAEAVDIDPNAVQVVTENMERNGISTDRYHVYAGNILEDEGLIARFSGQAYDVVEANIVADIIIALSSMVPKMIKPEGIFISSGIISERLNDVEQTLQENGFRILDIKREKDWVAIASRYEG